MDSKIVNNITNILKEAFKKSEAILLHEVIWTIDAKHHLIVSLNELNSAIKLVGGVQKNYLNSEVKLSRSDGSESDYLIHDDIEKAMTVYNQHLNP
tara:strand:- start:123 stop:410 length:288 start_codon:yes stop_codon:yes gene_type:complete